MWKERLIEGRNRVDAEVNLRIHTIACMDRDS